MFEQTLTTFVLAVEGTFLVYFLTLNTLYLVPTVREPMPSPKGVCK